MFIMVRISAGYVLFLLLCLRRGLLEDNMGVGTAYTEVVYTGIVFSSGPWELFGRYL